jgi:hypothetical protein
MSFDPSTRKPISLAAERAVRYLRDRRAPVGSSELARAVMRTRVRDEEVARRVLETAFAEDPRLAFEEGAWRVRAARAPRPGAEEPAPEQPPAERPRVLLLVRGESAARGSVFTLREVAAIRIERDAVVAACGGEVSGRGASADLKNAVRETLAGAVPVLHDPPGATAALERWLDEPLDAPVSLRRLGQDRLGLAARHDLEALVARLKLPWRDSDDPLDLVESVDAALAALRRPGEDLDSLRAACRHGARPPDWSRFAFGREFLREIPHVAGTYRFFDAEGKLLYVGKSRNLHARVGSYFREARSRPARVQELLDALHRIEIEPVGSDLEAVLREAAAIRRRNPSRNVQRKHHPRGRHDDRLRSILILEPASPPYVLWAYLLRDARLLDRVGIGRRGGGLRRIQRVLEARFFSYEPGPTAPPGPNVDVEVVARWLAGNRDRVVAFDPTHLRSAREVILRLRLFLAQGTPFEADGTPTTVR